MINPQASARVSQPMDECINWWGYITKVGYGRVGRVMIRPEMPIMTVRLAEVVCWGDLVPLRASDVTRFWRKVTVGDTDDCWLWKGVPSTKWYGGFGLAGKVIQAHRLAYQMLVGPIPKGQCIDHLCQEKHCVNPKHMELVTRAENVMRGDSVPAKNGRKTHCNRGHPLSGDNLYSAPSNNKRYCRKCQKLNRGKL